MIALWWRSGSACSIALGKGLTDAAPGSVAGLQLVVEDVHQARGELAQRGVEVGEVQDFPWGSFVFFSDPDGNRWSFSRSRRADAPARAVGQNPARRKELSWH